MPDSINDNSSLLSYFARIDGAPQGVQQILQDISSIGVDGVALRKEARRPERFEILTEVYTSTAANAATLRAKYDAFAGKLVTLTLQGVAYANVAIEAPVLVEPFVPCRAFFVTLDDGTASSGDAFRVRARWRMIYAGTP